MVADELKARVVRKSAGARPVFLAVFVAVLMVGSAALIFGAGVALAQGSPCPGGNVCGVEPDPQIEGNVTVSTHASGAATLAYTNAAGATLALNATLDPRVANPIQLNPTDVVAAGLLQADKINGAYWNATGTGWDTFYNGLASGSVLTGPTAATVNGQPAVKYVANTSNAATGYARIAYAIPYSSLPSSNLVFDYLTIGLTLSGAANSAVAATPSVWNQSSGQIWAPEQYLSNGTVRGYDGTVTNAVTAEPGQAAYFSLPLSQVTCKKGAFGSCATVPGATSITTLYLGFNLAFPKVASASYTITVTDLAVGTTPYTFGTTLWNKVSTTQYVFGNATGPANLTALAPGFTYSTVGGGGYTAAIVQTANTLPSSAVTITQGTVSVANATAGGPGYVEEITYSFAYGLPIAPSLSYGTFNLQDEVFVTGPQYVSVSFGGTSYTTTYQGYGVCGTSGTCPGIGVYHAVQASVTPTTVQTWTGVVYFTGSQWDSIAKAPGLFSATGLEYVWFLLIGAIVAIFGGSAWVVSQERGLKVRRGVGPAVFGTGIGRQRETWRGGSRPLRKNRLGMAARHGVMVGLGLITLGAGAIALWAYTSGADPAGIAGSFVAGYLVLLAVAATAFVVYEIAHWARRRKHH